MIEIDYDRVEAVLFDVGGVFLIPHHEVLRPILGKIVGGLPADETFHLAHYSGIRLDASETTDDQFWAGYNRRYVEALALGDEHHHALATAIHHVWLSGMNLWSWELTTNIEALSAISSRARTGIVSNADGTVERQLANAGICQVGAGRGTEVEVVVDSSAVGVAKPNPAIFAFALEPMDLPADRVLYVGDTHRYDVIGAQRAGLQVVHLDPYRLHRDEGHACIDSLWDIHDALR